MSPSRVTALGWVAVIGAVTWAALSPSSPYKWSDEDSVSVLTPERACVLAKAAAGEDFLGVSCRDFASNDFAAHLTLENGPSSRTVCLLKAARWFVVDQSFEERCPEVPFAQWDGRITGLSEELRVEARWRELVVDGRHRSNSDLMRTLLANVLATWRREGAPAKCPASLPSGKVLAVDADLVQRSEDPAWHFLTDDSVERAIDGATYVAFAGEEALKLRRQAPLVLLVDASKKTFAKTSQHGELEAKVALVDWVTCKVLCEAQVSVTQPNVLPHQYGTDEPDLPMADLKARVFTGLRDATARMSDATLELSPTF